MKWYTNFTVKFDSFIKVLVFIVVFHGLCMITWSYILATLGLMEIAEDLSQTIVVQIIAPVIVYGISKTVENVFKYNDIGNFQPKDEVIENE